jgi:thiol-disulfide isomerase/thioredoxin
MISTSNQGAGEMIGIHRFLFASWANFPRYLIVPAVCCLAVALISTTGCNSQPPGQNEASAPPKLSIGAEQGSDSNGANADTASNTSTAANTASGSATADQSIDSKNKIDPALQSLLNDLETNAKAWQEGKPFDFAPSAAKISQRLTVDFNQTQLELAHDAAQLFIMAGAYDPARQVYTALQKAAEKAPDLQISTPAREIARSGLTRLDLLNSSPTIEGTVYDGGQFDWSKYLGKVVLIDFWATWCPHCVEEIPDVKQIYEKYHDQGFDVVGISLDDDKKALAEFLDKKPLPWVTLFSDEPAKQGWEGAAMTKAFAIEELPTMIMIDRTGKIVSISARGEAMQPLVEKLVAEKP